MCKINIESNFFNKAEFIEELKSHYKKIYESKNKKKYWRLYPILNSLIFPSK